MRASKAYERFNEKVFLSNSLNKNPKKKRMSIMQILKKSDSSKKLYMINRSANKSKKFQSTDHSP